MARTLAEQYGRQEGWRRWSEALALVPLKPGDRVLDLGCGVGQVSARLHELGAEVIGVDRNDELLSAARARCPTLRFVKADLGELSPGSLGRVDGIWTSFVPAYFPSLEPALARWSACLEPGGWLAMVEVDDLFGHEPFPEEFRGDLARFYDEARRAGGYDFEAGCRLAGTARSVGLEVLHEGVLHDDELCFAGPATPEVLEAWRDRFARLAGLSTFLADRFERFEKAFLATLTSERHRSTGRVVMVVAQRRRAPVGSSARGDTYQHHR